MNLLLHWWRTCSVGRELQKTRWGKDEGTTSAPRQISMCFFLFFLPPIIPLVLHFCGILCLFFSRMGFFAFPFIIFFKILSRCPMMHFSSLIGCLKLKKQSLLFVLLYTLPFHLRKGEKSECWKLLAPFYILCYFWDMQILFTGKGRKKTWQRDLGHAIGSKWSIVFTPWGNPWAAGSAS